MLTDAQKGILTDWHDMMAQAYLYGANTAASKGKLSPWVPALSKDEPCNVCEESDISDYDQAAQAAFEAHSQLENEAKKPEFDAEYQAAVEKGLTDGAEGNPKEYSPKVVWWEGYRAHLDQAYANGYDKAESVSGENKISKAWWIAGGIAAVVLVGVPIVFGGLLIGEGSKKNPAKYRALKYEYQLRGSGKDGVTTGYGLVHHADTIAEAIESAKRNEPDFDILEVKSNKTGRIAGIYERLSPGNWKKVG